MTNSDSGTVSNSPSGTKLANLKEEPTPDLADLYGELAGCDQATPLAR
jgi:hypothetical protein